MTIHALEIGALEIGALNPCATKTVLYIRFQANFRLNKIPLKFVTHLVVDAQLIK